MRHVGGLCGRWAYVTFTLLVFTVRAAMSVSITVSLLGLFVLGVVVVSFIDALRWRFGGRMTLLAGMTALVGFVVGRTIEWWRVG